MHTANLADGRCLEALRVSASLVGPVRDDVAVRVPGEPARRAELVVGDRGQRDRQ